MVNTAESSLGDLLNWGVRHGYLIGPMAELSKLPAGPARVLAQIVSARESSMHDSDSVLWELRRRFAWSERVELGCGYTFHIQSLRVTDGNGEVHLQPKQRAVLIFLLARHGQAVSYNELFSAVWAGSPSDPQTMLVCVRSLRKALPAGEGVSGHNHWLIETLRDFGYRLDLPAV